MRALRAAVPIVLILAIGAVARIWQLAQNDFGRQYYAAAVRSMMESWHSVFLQFVDPAGFVSLDKPPVAIWLQAVIAKLLGFSGHSILRRRRSSLGLVAILLLYLIVQRTFGRTAAIWAALALAVHASQRRCRPLQQYRELSHRRAAGCRRGSPCAPPRPGGSRSTAAPWPCSASASTSRWARRWSWRRSLPSPSA